jgi:hypothetical protein
MSANVNLISGYTAVVTPRAASSVQSARGGTFEALGRLRAGLENCVAQLLLLPPARSPAGLLAPAKPDPQQTGREQMKRWLEAGGIYTH